MQHRAEIFAKMNGKANGGGGEHGAFDEDDVRAEILNPFVHKIEMDNLVDKIKTAVFTVVLLPFRVIVITAVLVAAWFLACIGLHGLSEETLLTKPMTGWRSSLRRFVCRMVRAMFVVCGWHGVRVLGEQRRAPPRVAPVLCVAPHSSFFDAIALVWLGAPSVVAKADTARLPFFGQLINYTQPVYVWRDDPNSRQNTIRRIIERATSVDQNWPQVLIFPEGTCTNRSCLITFKPGGFYPGVPIQPVTIRYPNTMDTVTWTWEGPGALKLLWLTLTQVHSACEIEFLPVYYPNEEEKKDPRLFARNVRDVMAKSLGLPVSDYTYDDCLLIKRAKNLNIPGATKIVEAQKLREIIGLEASNLECHLVGRAFGPVDNTRLDGIDWVEFPTFAKRLGINQQDPAAHKLFTLFASKRNGMVNWKNYLLSAVFLSQHDSPVTQLLNYAFKIFDSSGRGHLSQRDFTLAVCHSIGVPSHEDAHAHFQQADLDENNYLTFDEFLSYARKKPEFSYIFKTEPSNKKIH